MTRAVPGLAAVVFASLAAGCTHDGQFSVSRALGWEEVKTPKAPEFPRGTVATAERVETLGNKILARNTFTGILPMFHTIGVPESVLFHRGTEELFVSEGLVKQCKTEAELAAVLCSELGQMAAEKKAARRVGADRDTFPENGLPGGTTVTMGGGTPDDPGRAAEIAFQQRRKPMAEPADSGKAARDLLRGAGYEPAELDRVEPLLKQSDRGAALLRKQMSNSAPAPKWDK